MRLNPFVAFAVAAALILPAAGPAEAQSGTPKKRTQIIIKKRSYLDAGTTVKPGSQSYHDYAFGPEMRNPYYGPSTGPLAESSFGGQRWPLLRWWEGY